MMMSKLSETFGECQMFSAFFLMPSHAMLCYAMPICKKSRTDSQAAVAEEITG